MGSTASVSGLSSGLDTASIVAQLMQIESIPKTQLQNQLTSEKSSLSALQALNSQVAALTQQAKTLTSASAWSPLAITSSLTGVTATATTATTTTGAVATGTTAIHVDQAARAHSLRFTSTAAGSDVVVPTGTITVTTASGSTSLSVGSGSMNELVGALNAPGTGLVASTVRQDDGTLRLTVRSATTGAASAFSITDANGNDVLGGASITAGQDARITVDGDTLSSATNTFVNVLGGIDLTVSATAAGQDTTLTVGRDSASLATSMKSLVTAVNAVLSKIDTLTASSATSGASGVLSGDSTLRGLRDQLVDTVFGSGNTSLAPYGIALNRSGQLTFDADRFTAAATADPTTVQQALGGSGFVGRLATVSDGASSSTTGYLTSAVTGRQQGINRLQDSIDAWTRRLDLREASLKATYVAMETALSKINSQSSWLSSQIASLTSSS